MAKEKNRTNKKPVYTSRNDQDKYWESCMAVGASIYYGFMMIIYVLYCHHGYVEYDLYKRNIFIGMSLLYLIVMTVMYVWSRLDVCTTPFAIPIQKRFDKLDYLMGGTLVAWLIGFVGSADKRTAFWGDSYRQIGLVLMGLMLLTTWMTSRFVKWNETLTKIFWGICACENFYQILQYYSIDPFNWQFDGQYPQLLATLGAVNHNGCFCVIELAVLMVMFFHSEDIKTEIINGVMIFLAFTGGIAIRSSVFYLGLGITVLVITGYTLSHLEYLKKLWIEGAIFIATIIVQAIAYPSLVEGKLAMEDITLKLFSIKMIIFMVVVLAIFAGVVYLIEAKYSKENMLLSKLYKAIVCVGAGLGVLTMIVANVAKSVASNGILSKLVITDNFGTGRGIIWRQSLGLFGKGNVFEKLFGIGFNNFSSRFIQAYPDGEIDAFTGGGTLADAHNAYIDMLISTGIVGAVLYFGLLVLLLVEFTKLLKTNKNAMYGIMGIVSYFAVSLINSNLIVTTPIVWMIIGVTWKMIKEKQYEELGGL